MATTNQRSITLNGVQSLEYGHTKSVADKRNVMLHATMLTIYASLLLSFSSAPAVIETAKIGARAMVFPALFLINALAIPRTDSRRVLFHLSFFLLYLLLAFASVKWSGNGSYSFKQAVTYMMVLFWAGTLARLSNNLNHASIILLHLVVLLFIRSCTMLAGRVMYGSAVIERGKLDQLWHATDAADTAGLGLCLIFSCALVGNFKWAKTILIPTALAFAATMVVAHNRLTMVITPLVIGSVIAATIGRRTMLPALFALCLLVPAFLVFDAQTDFMGDAMGATEKIASRGGDKEFWSFSGRDELWPVIWTEFMNSKFVGQGYMVTSAAGEVYVWYELKNFDAHNLVLHVLATMGLFGAFFFFTAVGMMVRLLWINIFRHDSKGRMARTLVVVVAWLVLWGLLNSAFGAYINSSHIVFYAIVGICIGCLRKSADPSSRSNAAETNRKDAALPAPPKSSVQTPIVS